MNNKKIKRICDGRRTRVDLTTTIRDIFGINLQRVVTMWIAYGRNSEAAWSEFMKECKVLDHKHDPGYPGPKTDVTLADLFSYWGIEIDIDTTSCDGPADTFVPAAYRPLLEYIGGGQGYVENGGGVK